MDVKDAILNRKSIRKFDGKSIDNDTIKEIIRIAQKAPSWVNAQTVRINVAKDKTLDKIKKDHYDLNTNPNVHGNPIIPFREMDKWDDVSQKNMQHWLSNNQKQVGSEWGNLVSENSNHLYNASAVVYLSLPNNYSEWSLIDLGLLAQSIMLAAYEMGIDSLPSYEFVKYPKKLSDNLSLDDHEKVIFGIGLGYRDDNDSINNIKSDRMNTNDVLSILD
ncbi:hypothetical protein DY123_04960 [Apilactobacillus micheneri]|uniref:nitroreductase n=1 Tax=Apilactobacillus micheneri TaxID=1899430 RepID=UPI00112A7B8D|nr:nitroreductase [Apilactobacillus micheneri]TPR41884.1 hypothetical protein DY123_04960 [Apilactobacillus micheneri]